MIQLKKLGILIAVTAVSLLTVGQKGYAQDYCLPGEDTWIYSANWQNTTACNATGLSIPISTTPPATICPTQVQMSAPNYLSYPTTFTIGTWNAGSQTSITAMFSDPVGGAVVPGGWVNVGVTFLADPNGPNGVPQHIGSGTWSPGCGSGGGGVNPLTPIWTETNVYTVVQAQNFQCLSCTTPTGWSWTEFNGSFVKMQNFTNETVFASYALLTSPTLIPLSQLNPSLGGFGSFTPVTQYQPTNPCLLNCGPKSSTLFSDLGTGSNVYQASNGLPVSGTGSPGATSYTEANQFTAAASGAISEIDVAVGTVSGTNSFFVSLYITSGGAPGTLVAQWSNLSSSQSFGGCCGLVSITGITGVDVVAGTSYFLVIGPTNLDSTTSEMWNLNSVGAVGLDLYATSGCQNGSGNGCSWNSNGVQTLGAFDILGSTGGGSPTKSMVKK